MIHELREKVKSLDAELVRLLAARLELADRIGLEKKIAGMAIYDPETETAVIGRARDLAAELGISPAVAEAVMRTAMAEARLRQDSAGMPAIEGANLALSRYIPPPMDFKGAVPISRNAAETVGNARKAIKKILDGKDGRTLLILGPCSMHHTGEALEYARKLIELQKKSERFLMVMRVYVEKGRSGTGWTGFLADPRLDGSGDVQEGIAETRKLLNCLGEMGMPAAAEFVNPITPAYIGDLVSWASIGARSSGSQVHRDMASGLGMPVGFKNGLDGRADAAVGAVESAAMGHDYLGLDDAGHVSAFKTGGNGHCHMVLRGGERPNYHEEDVKAAQEALMSAGLRPKLMVDCSHGNSGKIAANQIDVFRNVVSQIADGNHDIIGLMLESHLNPGRQDSGPGMKRGVSVTDECLGWEETEALVLKGNEMLAQE